MSAFERPQETDAPRPKQPLYVRMYFRPVYTELVRFIGYGGKPLGEAEQFVLELEKKYGRDKVIEAGEAVSTCEGKAENLRVRLTAEARRLAWQLLGPPPEYKATDMIAEILARGKQVTSSESPAETAKARKPRVKKAPKVPLTPIQQQYREAKERHPGMLLLFKIGDTYEAFDEDAWTVARAFDLSLKGRDGTMTASFSHDELEHHLQKLLKDGHRVAVCDQVEESLPRKPVRRDVTRVVTPGDAAIASASPGIPSQEHGSSTSTADQSSPPNLSSTPAPSSPHAGSRTQSTARKRQQPNR